MRIEDDGLVVVEETVGKEHGDGVGLFESPPKVHRRLPWAHRLFFFDFDKSMMVVLKKLAKVPDLVQMFS